MITVKNNLIFCLTFFCFSGFAQGGNNDQKIILTTSEVIYSLRNCDTSVILKLLDTSFAHTNMANYRTYLKESFLHDCGIFNKIIERHGLPDLNNLIFKKDSSHLPPANIAILPIIKKEDSILNIKRCFLLLAFYPDVFFNSNSHLLKYSLVIERLKVDNPDKVEMPDWLKKLNGN